MYLHNDVTRSSNPIPLFATMSRYWLRYCTSYTYSWIQIPTYSDSDSNSLTIFTTSLCLNPKQLSAIAITIVTPISNIFTYCQLKQDIVSKWLQHNKVVSIYLLVALYCNFETNVIHYVRAFNTLFNKFM